MWTKLLNFVLLPVGRWLWREIVEELTERKTQAVVTDELVARVKAQVVAELRAEGWAPKDSTPAA